MERKVRYILLIVAFFVATVMLSGCKEKIKVEGKICNGALPSYEVKVTSSPVDLIVRLTSSNGQWLEETISKKDLSFGPVTISFSLAKLGKDGPVDFSHGQHLTKTNNCRLLIKRVESLKTIYEEEITFLSKNDNISIANPN